MRSSLTVIRTCAGNRSGQGGRHRASQGPRWARRELAHLLVDWPEHAQLAESDVKGRASEFDALTRLGGALDDNDIDRAGEGRRVDVLVVLDSLCTRPRSPSARSRGRWVELVRRTFATQLAIFVPFYLGGDVQRALVGPTQLYKSKQSTR
jgi:hypothetical protein